MDQSLPIDREHLEDISGGDREFEAELMQEFVSSTPTLLSDLEQAIKEGDHAAAQMAAHTIKGSCRSLGAGPMAEPCLEIELSAREGSLEGAMGHFAEICAHYRVLCAFIEKTWNVKAA
jgi:HPt (histidine-containing phosphotransfer) domain-containing protein